MLSIYYLNGIYECLLNMRPSEESETLPEIRGQMETDSETLPEIQGQMERERDAAGNPGTDRQIARSCWKARDRARGCRKAGDRWKQRARRCRRARDRARDVAGKPEPESETLPESQNQRVRRCRKARTRE